MAASAPGITKKAKQGGIAGLIVTAVAGLGTTGAQYAENSKLQETILAMHKENSVMARECFSHLSREDFAGVSRVIAASRSNEPEDPAHAHAPEETPE